MIEYKELKPLTPKIKPYIDSCVSITWDEESIKSKDILPRPGVSMIFTNKKILVNDKNSIYR
jgi:hypothetical protein